MSSSPFLSVLLAVDQDGLELVPGTVATVQAQTSGDWELVAYPASDAVSVDHLRAALAQTDQVSVVDAVGTGAERAQAAVDRARGEFVCWLRSGVSMSVDAVAALQTTAQSAPDLDVAYADELVFGAGGIPDLLRKPAWSPERLRGHCYPGQLVAMRTSLVVEVGGIRTIFDGAHEHDLLLRVSEAARRIERVPIVGVSRPWDGDQTDDEAWRVGVQAVQEHLDRRGLEVQARQGTVPGTYRLDRQLDPDVSVSVVIPTQGAVGLAWGERRCFVLDAVRSVLADVSSRRCEVVVVYNQDTPARVIEELRALRPRVRLDGYIGSFSFARMCNRGVTVSGGQVVVLLDERTQIDCEDFIGQLAAPLLEPGVGLTGPCVVGSDGKVLEGGLAWFQDQYEQMFVGELGGAGAENPALGANRECSALGDTCLALTRDVFEQVGGLNERHPRSAHVDLARKVARLELRRLWIAHATLRFFPPPGWRDRRLRGGDRRWLSSRWAAPDLDEYAPLHGERQLRRARRQAEKRREEQRSEKRRTKKAQRSPLL